jgi:hypothetical protein
MTEPVSGAVNTDSQDSVNTGTQDTSTGDVNTPDSSEPSPVYRTQEDFDAAFEKRLAREKKKLQKDLETAAAEDARKKSMSETERLANEKAEAENKLSATVASANQKIVKAEARAVAAGLGVPAQKLPYITRLADFTEVDVDDDGEVDSGALTASINKVLKDIPELKASTEADPGEESLATPIGRRQVRTPDATPSNGGGRSSKDQFNDILRRRGLRGS